MILKPLNIRILASVGIVATLVVLTTPIARADSLGFGIHIGNGGSSSRWHDHSGSWRNDTWRNDRWRSDPWRNDFNRDYGFSTHRSSGFEITQRPQYRSHHRWHDPAPTWNDDWAWRNRTHWDYYDEPRFEYRAEPRRYRDEDEPHIEIKNRSPYPSTSPKAAPKPAPKAAPVEPFEADEEDSTLHYCPSARGFYPAVRECPEGWQRQTGVKVQ
ncbi:MAG: hypothetical protein EOP11_07890 [Proteobacteria bacterium]|nr:MAG: hypothetical protein EOP11_07890 [Pseudomonadota bacterium]